MTAYAAPIRTFHPRRGRMGVTTAAALSRLWPAYGHDIPAPFDARRLFGRDAPLVLEIGSGTGEATIAMASADPARDYLAVDVHTPGLGKLLMQVEALGLTNVRAARGDALELVRDGIGDEELDAIHIFFPDPWPKARHHRRRIIQPETVALLRSRLRVGGLLHTATDCADYAEQMRAVLAADPYLTDAMADAARHPCRPITKYERRGLAAGRTIADMVYARIPGT